MHCSTVVFTYDSPAPTPPVTVTPMPAKVRKIPKKRVYMAHTPPKPDLAMALTLFACILFLKRKKQRNLNNLAKQANYRA
jgi:hypothetical protein